MGASQSTKRTLDLANVIGYGVVQFSDVMDSRCEMKHFNHLHEKGFKEIEMLFCGRL